MNTENYYPGISYQRLFNQINESGSNPTISQMQDIINVVKEDFLKDIEKEIAYKAWRAAADAFRMYPDNKHTFSDYWETVK